MIDSSVKDIKIAVIGGGTGSFMVLSELKKYSSEITAIVNMADDGGSTGVLRDELGVLPPGDVRQCLIALSESPKVRDLFNYRFNEGTFKGHSFGNLLLTAMEKVTGNFQEAVETASEILRVNGLVVPATLDNVRLKMEWPNKSLVLHGERVIDVNYFQLDPRKATLSLIPEAKPNKAAITAIESADLVIVAPGDLYTSLGPLLIIDGVGDALARTKALKVYISNLVTKRGQTSGFTVSDHASEIERFAGQEFLDIVLYNDQVPSKEMMESYKDEGSYITQIDRERLDNSHFRSMTGHFLSDSAVEAEEADVLKTGQSLIRHDQTRLVKAIMEIYKSERK